MTIVEKIKAELKAFEDKRNKLVKELQKDFPGMFQPLFEKSEKINSIGWTQYTPFFNDGDECIFNVHNSGDDFYINGEYVWDIETENNFWDEEIGYNPKELNPNYNQKEAEILNEFQQVLTSIPDDFYKELFGDHCQVTLNRDGTINVEEYDHD